MRVLVNESVRDVIYTSDQLTETDKTYFLFKIHDIMNIRTLKGTAADLHAIMWLMLTCSSSCCRLRSSSIRAVTWSSCVCADDCSTDDITEHIKNGTECHSAYDVWERNVRKEACDVFMNGSLNRWLVKKQNTDSFRNKTLWLELFSLAKQQKSTI